MRVLVTGGTGSFGKQFVSDLLHDENVDSIVILSRDELKQYEMEKQFNDERLRFFLGDVRDRDRLYRAFDGVDVVVHAAALKQVPAAEYNPMEFIKTNVIGGSNVIDAALDRGVKKVIALSTDKAVNPANLYGATKLCSDKLFIAANSYARADGTKFSVVRYGNVMDSRGSVVPFFRSAGPVVPITHPDMTRFWITIPEASQFVLHKMSIMKGGEIFVPKLPTVRIVDIAAAMGRSWRVAGIRPGEKIHESLLSEDESRNARDCGSYYTVGQYTCDCAPCEPGFTYTSDQRGWVLTVDELEALIGEVVCEAV
jgi:UDP-N-acetylglucosamine 4,6-dehydratase/5-epimerase